MLMLKIDKKRKYFLMAMVFLLMLGGIYRIWPIIQGMGGAEDEIAIKKKQLVKYQRMVQSAHNLESETELLRQTLKQGESGLLTGKTSALAAADIQKIVHGMAKKSQVEIKRVRVLKPVDVGESHYFSIPVQLSISGSIRQLKEFLYQIMGSSKYLTVEKVGITVHRRRLRRGSNKHMESIKADITVNGFLKRSDAQVQ